MENTRLLTRRPRDEYSVAPIEWRKIAGLRDIVAHQYFSLNLVIIWDVVENRLSDLRTAATALLEADFDEQP